MVESSEKFGYLEEGVESTNGMRISFNLYSFKMKKRLGQKIFNIVIEWEILAKQFI